MFTSTNNLFYDRSKYVNNASWRTSLALCLLFSSSYLNASASDYPSIGSETTGYNFSAVAIQSVITGKVIDKDGKPIDRATVAVKDGVLSVKTDDSGHFRINASTGSVLVISSVGYKSSEIKVLPNKNSYDIILNNELQDLDEVVVVGYGSQKKVNLTGAVSVIKGDDITKHPVGQTSAALQGAAPGLTVTQGSGQPGRDVGTLRIRGIGTIGDANPLVLIDGIEGNINNVNAADIANISVLKDASSAAIYGARAANGVILITTKRANEGGFSLSYNNYFGIQKPTEAPQMVNGLDHMLLLNEAYTNVGLSPVFTDTYIDQYKVGMNSNPDLYPNTDWTKLTMKDNGFVQNHHVSVSGGSDRVRVFSSLGLVDQKGIIANTNFKRYNFRLNTDMKISDKFSSAVDIAFAKSELIEPSSGVTNIFHYIRRIPANQAGLLSSGQYGEGWNGNNPLAMAKDGGINAENPIDLMFNLDLKYKPFDGFTAQAVYSPKFLTSHNKRFTNTIQSYYADGSKAYLTPQRNSLDEQFNQTWYNNLRFILTYDKNINDNHHITLMGGYQQEDQSYKYLNAYREVFLLPEFQEINAGNSENQQNGGSSSVWALKSYFGRVNYNYQGKYLFEANARYDGSSRFATGNKYAFFPSFSAGWRISEESFMAATRDVITDMKFRASWGRLGNQSIGTYPSSSAISLGSTNYNFGNNLYTGAALTTMANSEIKWETTTVTDIGIDLNLWRNLTITADYFYRKTDDILLQLDIPKALGLSNPYQNAGVVENKGWDIAVAYRNVLGDLKYNIAVNLSDVKNNILDMKGVLRTGLTVNHEGNPIGSLYGYEALGYFQSDSEIASAAKQFGVVAPGDIKYKDQNGDGVINSADEVIIGSPIPRYSYSANIGLEYKGFDLSIFLQGVGKADGYLYNQGIFPFFQGGTAQEQHKDRWSADNQDASFPRLAFNGTNNIQNSTFWMKNSAYLRLKNIGLGYTIPLTKIGSTTINNLRVFVTGQNLFTSTKFWKGFDPEGPISTGGWYPQMKVYSMGLSVKF
ncbi:SusC/RagA family TonB-linked outer membrane protein [Sphingobacterium rhinopitheci]|uniref:SusC/RagA family TonB-linked outer membrane protein n=1 Tax=Sphingobacterium rhinopitheci TaxID=2781960 RepID=UPI001F52012D|nr:TonB-dependent receptor [Sphingobacterium rhinopitheci]MCI0920323.1 TonB-dependent receptor [Sphingobacterium rhinopitheci]